MAEAAGYEAGHEAAGNESLFESFASNMQDFKRKCQALEKERTYLKTARAHLIRDMSLLDEAWNSESVGFDIAIRNLVEKKKKRREEYNEKRSLLEENATNQEIRERSASEKQKKLEKKIKSMIAFLANDNQSQIASDESDEFGDED